MERGQLNTARWRQTPRKPPPPPSLLPAREISDEDPLPARPDRAQLISAEPKRAEMPVSGDGRGRRWRVDRGGARRWLRGQG